MAITNIPWNLLGFRVAGDLGGFTCYTDRNGKKVWYKKAPPDKPPSPAQLHRRNLFRRAVLAWKLLSPEQKASLETATRTLALCLTGQNLYVSCAMKSANGVYATIARQSHQTLPPLPILT